MIGISQEKRDLSKDLKQINFFKHVTTLENYKKIKEINADALFLFCK